MVLQLAKRSRGEGPEQGLEAMGESRARSSGLCAGLQIERLQGCGRIGNGRVREVEEVVRTAPLRRNSQGAARNMRVVERNESTRESAASLVRTRSDNVGLEEFVD